MTTDGKGKDWRLVAMNSNFMQGPRSLSRKLPLLTFVGNVWVSIATVRANSYVRTYVTHVYTEKEKKRFVGSFDRSIDEQRRREGGWWKDSGEENDENV